MTSGTAARRENISLHQKLGLAAFGLFLTFLILELALRLGGFIILSMQAHRNTLSLRQKGVYRIMCIGESTTQGQYPALLEQALNARNIGVRFSVIDQGIGGTTTSIILSLLEKNIDTYHPNMVLAMMGVNDWGPHMPDEPRSDSKLISLIRSFRTYKLTRLVWLHLRTKVQEIAWHYEAQGRLQKTANAVERPPETGPQNSKDHYELGDFYKVHNELAKAEKEFKKALIVNPRNDEAYRRLGGIYRAYGRLSAAEEAYRKAIKINSKNGYAYFELGDLYFGDLGKSSAPGAAIKAEAAFKKAIEINPQNVNAYFELGKLYGSLHNGRDQEAESALQKSLEINPANHIACLDLAWLFLAQGQPSRAQTVLKKFIESNSRIYGALSATYEEMGNIEFAKEYHAKAEELRLKEYNPIVEDNYHRLKDILDRRGIKLVCIQYPMCSIAPLERIFQGERGIAFVDNERIFKEAVERTSYREYFRDLFGGDFGHCTPKGNQLLAENIAQAIVREVAGY
jgi:tetratricopeptide (TPR) repeat protein